MSSATSSSTVHVTHCRAGITDAVPLVDDHGHRGVVVAAFGFGFDLPRSEGELGGVLQLGDDAATAEGR
ncbi:MAG: hypothetical protein ACR2P2_10890 [Nakamurella sp.]